MKPETAQKILAETRNNYNQIAEAWDQTRQYISPDSEEFLKYIKNGDKVLDAGCGNGRLVKLFNGVKVDYIGIDNSEKLLNLARSSFPHFKFLAGDVLNLPFADNYFDIIFCWAVLHHLPGQNLRAQALQEMQRVLKAGGFIILLNWHYTSPKIINYLLKFTITKIFANSELDFGDIYLDFAKRGIKRYIHLFTKNEIKNLVEKVGFKVIRNYFSLPTKRGFRNLVTIAKKC